MGKHFDSNSRLDFESHPPVPLTTHSAFVYRDLASVNKVTPRAGLIDRRSQHGGIPRSQRKSTSNRLQSVTAQRLQGQDHEGFVITVSVTEVLSCPHHRAEPWFFFFGPVRSFAVALYSILATILYFSTSNWLQTASKSSTGVSYYDLTPIQASPRGHLAKEKILILTPLKDASQWLDEYFENLSKSVLAIRPQSRQRPC